MYFSSFYLFYTYYSKSPISTSGFDKLITSQIGHPTDLKKRRKINYFLWLKPVFAEKIKKIIKRKYHYPISGWYFLFIE